MVVIRFEVANVYFVGNDDDLFGLIGDGLREPFFSVIS